FHRRKNRLRLHHHPLPSTEGRVIYDAMLVARPSAQVMNVQVECTTFLSAFHHAFVERRAANFREKRDDIDAHEVANMRSSRSAVEGSRWSYLKAFAVGSLLGMTGLLHDFERRTLIMAR